MKPAFNFIVSVLQSIGTALGYLHSLCNNKPSNIPKGEAAG